MDGPRFQKLFLLALVVVISAAFVAMIRQFLMMIVLAGIFSGLSYPLFRKITKWAHGRESLAAILTIVILLIIVVGPVATLLGVVANEAARVTTAVRPWIQAQIEEPGHLLELARGLPGFEEYVEPYRTPILEKAGEMVGQVGRFFFDNISATTKGTVAFLFQFFLLLYTMFFFLIDGKELLRKILYYLPLPHEDEQRLVDKFISVTRATIKGTILIGLIQGGLAGAALAVAGIESAVFWATIMVVLSILPGIGTALVWGPAALYLMLSNHVGAGVGVALFCGLVVGSVDNFLRPRFVGRDAEMHDLMILFGTLGGIFFFGVAGFLIGPVIAALFVTIWDIYGYAFRDFLPEVEWATEAGPGGNVEEGAEAGTTVVTATTDAAEEIEQEAGETDTEMGPGPGSSA